VVFKGTSRRSAKTIACSIDALGGQLDAFTGREQACYYAKVLDDHLTEALDLLSDILLDPLLAPEDIERERRVILEEIKLVEDTPADSVFDLLYSSIFGEHPLGRPVLGTPQTVSNLKREDLVDWRQARLFSKNMIVSCSGSCRPDEVAEAVSRAFDLPRGNASNEKVPLPRPKRRLTIKEKASEQVHLCLGFLTVSESSPKRYIASVLNSIIGGGVASRLFQRIREEEGLAYAIHSFLDTYSDTGVLGIYAGISPKEIGRFLELVEGELQSIVQDGVDPEELKLAKDQFKGQMILALEDTVNRMSRLARQTITFGKTWTMEESIAMVDAVSLEDVQALAAETFKPSNMCLAVIGPTSQDEVEECWQKEEG
jgi:predicted Zn-dependent peptidase